MLSMDTALALGATLAPTVAFLVIGTIAWRRRHARRLPDTPANPSATTSALETPGTH